MPQCPFCKAAVWAGQQYCATCSNPLPHPEEENYCCPQCGTHLGTPQETCQKCKVTPPEIAGTPSPSPAPARAWKLPLRVPGMVIAAGFIIVALLLVFLLQKSPGPPQPARTPPPPPAASEQTPAAPPIPASKTAPAAPKVTAVQEVAAPSAPAASSPPAVATPTPALSRYFVNTHELTVRDGPNMDASPIAFLKFKDEVELLDTSGGWGEVRETQGDIVGWANLRYLQPLAVSEQTPAAPPIPASKTAPAAPKVTAVQEVAVPSAPAASSPPALTTPTAALPRYFVDTHELTVRDGPNMDSPRIATLNSKDEVELLETSGGWGRVRGVRRNIVGWSFMRYLQPLAADSPRAVSQPEPAAPKEPEPVSSEDADDE